MKSKTSYLFLLSQMKVPLMVFYAIVISILLIMKIIIGDKSIYFSNNTSSIIFILVSGLVGFKLEFLFLLQNGVSRKTLFKAKLLSMFTVVTFMTVIDLLISYIALSGKPFFLYSNHLLATILILFLYLTVFSASELISLLNYKLKLRAKQLTALTLLGGVLLVFAADSNLLDYKISISILNFIDFAFGITTDNPLSGIISGAILSGLFITTNYLLIKKLPVKE